MEFSWTTFVLEVINFVVLVWILKHFLYQPVLNIVEKRRGLVEQTTQEAKQLRQEAEEFQKKYQERLSEWEKEREHARDSLHREIDSERERLTQALTQTLEQERQKSKVLAERESAQQRHNNEEEALRQAGAFASRLLERVAGPELESKLVDMVATDLDKLSEEKLQSLRNTWQDSGGDVLVASAYVLDEESKTHLKTKLGELLGGAVELNCTQQPELIAGIRVSVGPWVLSASIKDELGFFTEFSDGSHDEA